jgi:hypothetical protein
MPSPNPEERNYRFRQIGSQRSADWKLRDRDLEGLVGKAFRQALRIGGHVRKGERGTIVVYADRFTPHGERLRAAATGEEAQAIPLLKRFAERCKDDRHHFRFTISPEDAGD